MTLKSLMTPRNMVIAVAVVLVLYLVLRPATKKSTGAALGSAQAVEDGQGAGHYQFDGSNQESRPRRVDDPGSDPSLQVTDAAGNVLA